MSDEATPEGEHEVETGVESDDSDPDVAGDIPEDVPEWDDEYVDRVSDRLMYNYDLDRDYWVDGEAFDLYGRLEIHTQKKFFHPAITYGHHESYEHLFLRRTEGIRVAELERLVALANDLVDRWIEADEEHYATEFTFVVVAPEIPDDVRAFVSSFRDRTMLKYGYNGYYEIHLAVVAPDREAVVTSERADVGDALTVWEPIDTTPPGPLERLKRRLLG
ncbi:hypothetical protein [Haloplanus aerogenes]|uniref:DUF8052 domain-containing protein n=1 Tax=Haloplanus aerogenes TaxID=660522 RepID=A0A3M0CV92_9EURY|nr:hypothetical protein [Haloplanus aerogenes]RMB13262.1 hypothetical protein ATH50_2595 [Haloplanus aerogenes]